MLDIKALRENPQILREVLSKRNMENPWKNDSMELNVESFFALQNQYLKLIQEIENLRTRKNKIAEEFGLRKKKGEDTATLSQETETLKKNLALLEEEFSKIDKKFLEATLRIPNLPHASVPPGKTANENVVLRQSPEIPELSSSAREHWEIGKNLNILDFEAAGKISGARFSLLKGKGAQLERALIAFMLDVHTREHGYTEIFAPFLVTAQSMQGTGQLPKFEEDLFKLERDGLYLIPTAEVSITNLHRDEILEESSLPKKYVSYSACFRREAGSYGKDTKGLIRNHQFNKIELVWVTTPKTSFEDLELLTRHAEAILKKLEIPYRVVALCGGDLGFAAAKTYDLEVWMPGEKKWREISSCSLFTDFQARRMNIKYKNLQGKKELVHTLNGSGVAVGRLFASILENYQEKDGSVKIPKALRPYLQMETIEK